jgi:hypothetical protein
LIPTIFDIYRLPLADSKVKCNTSQPVRSAGAFHLTALLPASA